MTLAPSMVAGQAVDRGSVRLRVTGEDGLPLQGALVIVRQGGRELPSLTTSRTGMAVQVSLDVGTVDVSVEAVGFRPAFIGGVGVVAGRITDLRVTLVAGRPPFDTVDTLPAPPPPSALSPATAGFAPASQAHLGSPLDPLRLAWVSNRVDRGFGIEGLPGGLTRTSVQGVPVGPAAVAPGLLRPMSHLSSPVNDPVVLTPEADVATLTGAGGGIMQTFAWPSRPLEASVELVPGAGVQGAVDGPEPSTGYGVQLAGAGSVSPAMRVGGSVEARKLDVPTFSLLGGDASSSLPASLGGVDIGALAAPRLRTLEHVRASGQMAWESEGQSFTLFGGMADLSDSGDGFRGGPGAYGSAPGVERTALWSGVRYRRAVSASSDFDLLVGFDSDEAEPDPAVDDGVPVTWVQSTGDRFGRSGRGLLLETTRGLFVSPRLNISRGADRSFVVGLRAATRNYGYTADGSAARYAFETPGDLAAGTGYQEVVEGLEDLDFDLGRVGVFAAGRFNVRDRGRVSVSLRAETLTHPLGDLALDTAFARRTGLELVDTDPVVASGAGVSFEWDLDPESVAFGTLSLGLGELDSGPVAEALAGIGGLTSYAATGAAIGWPTTSPAGTASVTDFSVLGAPYRAPRTVRTSVGVRRLLGPAQLSVTGIWRRTDFLYRRRDLNRSAPTAPGSLTIFPEYGRIWSLDPDGWSEYLGIEVGLTHDPTENVRLYGAYTLSRTVDNWVGASALDPDLRYAGGRGEEWDEARSDFDTPHRLSLGSEIRLPGALGASISARYRFQSALPFTALHNSLDDADGDGSVWHDTADLAGVSGLPSGWECLQVDGLAERNGCRGTGTHQLDLSFGVRVPGSPMGIFVDALGLVASEQGVVDPAVLSSVGGITAVNPEFGTFRQDWTPPRIFRLRLSFQP